MVENVQQKTSTHPKQNTDSNNNVITKATVEESLLEIARLAEEHAKVNFKNNFGMNLLFSSKLLAMNLILSPC